MRWFLPIFLFLLAGPGWAADQYWSECVYVSGGAGTVADPYCLDEDNDGQNESFQEAWDGAGSPADIAAGDSIILCCNGGTEGDACDVADSPCIFPLGGTGITVNSGPLTPSISGTLGNPLTVTYCNSGNGCSGTHTIRLSGDFDRDGVFDANSDLNTFIYNTGQDYIEFQCGTQNIIFENTGSNNDAMFYLVGADGWVFDGCEIRGDGDGMWQWAKAPDDATNQSHAYWGGADKGFQRGKTFKMVLGVCDFTFQNGLIHHTSGTVWRNTLNTPACTSGVNLIQNNEAYNIFRWNDSWSNWDWSTDSGKKIYHRNNYIHDTTSFMDFEHENFGHLIEDNIFLCVGEWQVQADGWCHEAGLTMAVANTGGDPCAESTGIEARRNIMGSRVDATTGAEKDCRTDSSGCGARSFTWIRFETQCNSSSGSGCAVSTGCAGMEADVIIENNIVLRHWPAESFGDDHDRAAIGVQTNQAGVVKIRNNTVYDSEIGIFVNGQTVEISPDVINNWILKSNDAGSRTVQELLLSSTANGGSITNNNFYHGGLGTGSTVVADVGGTTYDCDNISGLGSNNICSQAKAIKCDDSHNCTDGTSSNSITNWCDGACIGTPAPGWDLHLDPSDTVNKDAGTSTGGATDDIDQQGRDGSPDIGADELMASTDPVLQGGTLNGVTITQLNGWLGLPASETNTAYYKFWKARTKARASNGALSDVQISRLICP